MEFPPLSQKTAEVSERRYAVRTFTCQIEGGEAIIGLPELGTFAVVPIEALTVLDRIREGQSIAQIEEFLRNRDHEEYDLSPLVEGLIERGFLCFEDELVQMAPKRRFFSFGISALFARRVFGPWGLSIFATIISFATVLIARNPDLLPPVESLYLPERAHAILPALLLASLLAVAFHEFGHIMAARAAGVDARLGIGNRLWILVVEADLSGLWGVPRAKRYLPLLAGPLVDLVSLSLVILILAAQENAWIELRLGMVEFLRALAVGYYFALAWQTYFFLRTDFYYVFANVFGCKNLLADTATYLRHQLYRLVPWLVRLPKPLRPLAIPEREMKVVKAYSALFILGRGIAISMLLFVQIPLLFKYARFLLSRHVSGQPSFEAAIFVLSLLLLVLGFTLWFLELRRGRRPT